MLLNLSNHPSASWPENQIKIANKEFGEIQDMPFPHIDPLADEASIEDLAKQYLDRILDLEPKAVHLMGELTFSFKLVGLLKFHSITCLASTTHRTTVNLHDGTKISKFEFVRFRAY
jgi:hypothetical protein